MSRQKVAVLDFGSQYTQLIARRIREHNVYSEIYSHLIKAEQLKNKNIKAIILSGGPSSVYDKNAPKIDNDIFLLGIPILGICYGLHLMIYKSGGEVLHKGRGEYGYAIIETLSESPLFKNISKESKVWMSHGDEIGKLGQGYRSIARSSNNVVAAIEHENSMLFAVQFHPEVVNTVEGSKILYNFLFTISNCKSDWTAENFISDSIFKIKEKVGEAGKVITGISGGVDSSVVGVLLHKAIGDRSNCVFIDHGLLRKDEANEVMGTLKDGIGLNIKKFNCEKTFIACLKGIIDPEQKRKIIGEQFIRSFELAAQEYRDVDFLAQGTLYPDVIESGGSANGPAVLIKSHHNVGGLPDDMNFSLIEPIRDLFKDEVRKVGKKLGLPDFVLGRHPFPGPGLAVRILGEINNEYLRILRESDYIFINILKESGDYDKIWQAFCVLIPTKTVGVMGDSRTYENLIALRAVTSVDGMTADFYNMPNEILNKCSTEIINKVKGVNRVVYDITSKPPGTIEWE